MWRYHPDDNDDDDDDDEYKQEEKDPQTGLKCDKETTLSLKPRKPAKGATGSDYISIYWVKPDIENVDCYEVKYKPLTQLAWCQLSKFTKDDSPSICIDGLLPKTEYVFKVRALYEDNKSEFSEQSDPIQINQSPALSILETCRKCKDGKPSIFQLPVEEFSSARNEKYKTKKCEFGSSQTVQEKTILMMGSTGDGKSTLINGMINHLLGVKWEDEFRFKITKEISDQEAQQMESQTDWITSYRVHPINGTVDCIFNIIDTPGFGDTREIERDRELEEQIRAFFTTKGDKGIETIDAICFVTKGSSAGMTPTQSYIFNAILSIFGQDVKDNIIAMVTFADGEDPPVLNALSQAKVPYIKHFVFNNSALFAPNSERNMLPKMLWEMGSSSYTDFFKCLPSLKTQSLQLTADVLKMREQINATIQGLMAKIDIVLEKHAAVNILRHRLNIFETEIEDNKNFNYETVECVQRRIPLSPKKFVTNCIRCQTTCHYPCSILEDEDIKNCAAMSNGYCMICSEKCEWNLHKRTNYRVEVETVKCFKTYDEMKKKYEVAVKEKDTMAELVASMKKKFIGLKETIFNMITEVCECANFLRENAIKCDPITEIEYFDILIESETQMKQSGFLERMSMLKWIKRIAEMKFKAVYISVDDWMKEIGFDDDI